jgi:hypothetical protein
VVTGVKIGGVVDYEAAFGRNPDPGDDGWWIDSVAVSDTLTDPATVTADTKDNSGLAGCGGGCTVANASLVSIPSSTGAPGQSITLDASGSTLDVCLNGMAQYKFEKDTGSGFTLLRDWTDNAALVHSPAKTADYRVTLRCAEINQLTCSDTTDLNVFVDCPASGNLGGNFADIFADKLPAETLQWAGGASGIITSNTLAAGLVYSGSTSTTGAGSEAMADVVASGTGRWYNIKSAGGGGTFCNEISSWGSDDRDAILP